MNYQTFIQDLKTQVAQLLEPEVAIQVHQITKNNSVCYDALILVSPDSNLAPTIYLPPYYHRYLDGVDMAGIAADIVETYRQTLPNCDFDTTLFTDYEKAKHQIVMRLVSYEKNRELLKDVPHRRFLDFAVLFYCLLAAEAGAQASILIHNSHLSYWDISADTLYESALINTPQLLDYRLDNLPELLREIAPSEPLPSSDSLSPLYVLSNSYRTYGAAAILYPNLLSSLAESFEQNFVIIPSSVHEVLLIPVTEKPDMDSYNEMICEVNETQLSDEEILSDHAYFYSRKNHLLTSVPIG